jgi:hypothetical protein
MYVLSIQHYPHYLLARAYPDVTFSHRLHLSLRVWDGR